MVYHQKGKESHCWFDFIFAVKSAFTDNFQEPSSLSQFILIIYSWIFVFIYWSNSIKLNLKKCKTVKLYHIDNRSIRVEKGHGKHICATKTLLGSLPEYPFPSSSLYT